MRIHVVAIGENMWVYQNMKMAHFPHGGKGAVGLQKGKEFAIKGPQDFKGREGFWWRVKLNDIQRKRKF